jgi:hypothetical protein
VTGPGQRQARVAVISSPDLGVFAVAAAGVLWAFCLVDTLPEQCLRRRPDANPLVAAVFRTNRLLRERCSATCQRRRRPGQARHRQGRLQIAAVRRGRLWRGDSPVMRADLADLSGSAVRASAVLPGAPMDRTTRAPARSHPGAWRGLVKLCADRWTGVVSLAFLPGPAAFHRHRPEVVACPGHRKGLRPG